MGWMPAWGGCQYGMGASMGWVPLWGGCQYGVDASMGWVPAWSKTFLEPEWRHPLRLPQGSNIRLFYHFTVSIVQQILTQAPLHSRVLYWLIDTLLVPIQGIRQYYYFLIWRIHQSVKTSNSSNYNDCSIFFPELENSSAPSSCVWILFRVSSVNYFQNWCLFYSERTGIGRHGFIELSQYSR